MNQSFLEKVSQNNNAPQDENKQVILGKSLDPNSLPNEIKHIREQLLKASSQLVYISEGEEPYEFVFILAKEVKNLPENSKEFTNLIRAKNIDLLIEDEKSNQHSSDHEIDFQQFFNESVASSAEDLYGMKDGYRELAKTFLDIFHNEGNIKIYRIGARRVGLYIVGLVEDFGIAGLKTLSIET
nr:645_t:CDS:1 [Entrophospora candida]